MYITNYVRIEPHGIGFLTFPSLSDTLGFSPIRKTELIAEIFKLANIEITTSDAGITTNRIINHMGGIDECRIFKDENVRELFKLKPTKLITRTSINDKLKNLTQPLQRIYTNGSRFFNEMLKKKIFMVGVELKCEACEIKSWINLDNLNHYVTCEYCPNVINTAIQLKDRDWKFRLSGIFKHEHGDKGSFPVILTITTLLNPLNLITRCSSIFLPPTDIKFKKIKCETDFIILLTSELEENRPKVVIGECKNEGKIKQKSVDGLDVIAKELRKLDLDVYIVFSKLGEAPFSKAERTRFLALNDNGIRQVIILEKQDLESEFPYKNRDIQRSATNLENMTMITEYIFK